MTASSWKRICCAIDFSEPSRSALEEAVELARSSGAELHVLHVHARPSASAVDLLSAGFESVEADDSAEEALHAWADVASRALDRPVRAEVELGSAPAEIAAYAAREGIDLLVLATHGRTGLQRVVMGSVAERVVRLAPCPVLVVRHRAAAPLGAGPATGAQDAHHPA